MLDACTFFHISCTRTVKVGHMTGHVVRQDRVGVGVVHEKSGNNARMTPKGTANRVTRGRKKKSGPREEEEKKPKKRADTAGYHKQYFGWP